MLVLSTLRGWSGLFDSRAIGQCNFAAQARQDSPSEEL
jgi:hypothetical protein